EEHVELAERLLRRRDHLLAIGCFRHVGANMDCLVDQCGSVSRRLFIDVDHHDRRALLGEEQRRLPADAAARARDQRNLVFESHIRSKYRLCSQSVTAVSKAAASVRKKWLECSTTSSPNARCVNSLLEKRFIAAPSV